MQTDKFYSLYSWFFLSVTVLLLNSVTALDSNCSILPSKPENFSVFLARTRLPSVRDEVIVLRSLNEKITPRDIQLNVFCYNFLLDCW